MHYFFADTCFLVALKDPDDEHHSSATEIWDKMIDKKLIVDYTNFYISDYVMAETFQNLQNRISFRKTLDFHNEICDKCIVKKVSYPETIQRAIDTKMMVSCNRKTKKPNMGLIDATSLIVMEDNNLNYIISFDNHFENIPLLITISEPARLDFFI